MARTQITTDYRVIDHLWDLEWWRKSLLKLASGEWDWRHDLLPDVLTWMTQTGFTLLAVAFFAHVAWRLCDGLITRLFAMINYRLLPDDRIRMNQRTVTLAGILRSLCKVLIVFIASTIVLARLGVNVAPILASAGVVGLAVGFGAQSLVKDVISGFFVLLEDQYGVGDVIEVGGHTGVVERMNLRVTQIRHANGALISVPNGSVTTVTNHTKDWTRAIVDVGIGYAQSPEEVLAALQEIAATVVRILPEKTVRDVEVFGIEGFKDSELTYRIQLRVAPHAQAKASRELRLALWRAMREERLLPSSAVRQAFQSGGW